MIGVNEVIESLNSNQNLTAEIKQNLSTLIIIFNKNFPNVSLKVLNDKIKTLNIIRGSKFLIKNSSNYNIFENTIYINQSKIKEADNEFILMRELLNIITCADKFTGFNVDLEYSVLNKAYTDKLANFLVGNESEPEDIEALTIVDMLTTSFGDEAFIDAYFSNDVLKITNLIG